MHRMFAKTVRDGNKLMGNTAKAPFYEVYYLKFADPEGTWSFWTRYSLMMPRRKNEPATATLWGIFYDSQSQTVALKKSHPLTEIDIVHRDSFIRIEDSFLSIDQCTGYLENKTQKISWQLDFEDPTHSACLYPYDFLYKSGFPKTKFIEPRLSTRVTGHFEINGKTTVVQQTPAHQAHIWGAEYATRWAWGHCNNFQDAPELVFEGLVAQVPLGPFDSPKMALFHFLWDGQYYPATGLIKWMTNKSQYDLLHWYFDVKSRDLRFIGTITRDPSKTVGVEYNGPNGEKRYCHNTNTATMEIQLLRKVSGHWERQRKFLSQAASFETVEPTPDTRVNFVL